MPDLEQSTWGHVGLGSYVIGPDAGVWKCIDVEVRQVGSSLTLVNRAGDKVIIIRPDEDAPVQIPIYGPPIPATLEEFRQILGGTIIEETPWPA